MNIIRKKEEEEEKKLRLRWTIVWKQTKMYKFDCDRSIINKTNAIVF